jgi:hypothetical protein
VTVDEDGLPRECTDGVAIRTPVGTVSNQALKLLVRTPEILMAVALVSAFGFMLWIQLTTLQDMGADVAALVSKVDQLGSRVDLHEEEIDEYQAVTNAAKDLVLCIDQDLDHLQRELDVVPGICRGRYLPPGGR